MVGEKLGSFRIEGTLGVGAMGVVYKAVQETTNKPAAVKVVNKEISQRGKIYERFQREAEILQQFRHPNIVRFLALGRYKGTSYIAMEFIQGKTLEQVLHERGALPWQEVVELAEQMCDALHYAHEHGVVHRDLKPSNLMISAANKVKLTDFGIAKDLDKTALTATGRTLGTAAYMAPEQIRGTPAVSHKTDLYSMGAVLYQMLTGQPPFEGTSAVVLMHCHLNEAVPRPSAKVAEIPRALDDLVVQLMAKAPQDRPFDAAAVGQSLSQLREKKSKGEAIPMVWATDGPGPNPARLGGPPRKKKRKSAQSEELAGVLRRYETLGLVLALAVVGALIGYFLWPPSDEYLFARAEQLWKTGERHNRVLAIEKYIDPLDKRHPNNAYLETTQAWRDSLEMELVEKRARYLESPVTHDLFQPKTASEKLFKDYARKVASARNLNEKGKPHNDPLARDLYHELAGIYKDDDEDPKQKYWRMLAVKRADAIQKEIDERLDEVDGLIDEIAESRRRGRLDRAAASRERIEELAREYPDVVEHLESLGIKLAPPGVTPAPPAVSHPPPPARTTPAEHAGENPPR